MLRGVSDHKEQLASTHFIRLLILVHFSSAHSVGADADKLTPAL